jgi:hypothetical protein
VVAWAKGREQPRQNRHQHGLASCLLPDFQLALPPPQGACVLVVVVHDVPWVYQP